MRMHRQILEKRGRYKLYGVMLFPLSTNGSTTRKREPITTLNCIRSLEFYYSFELKGSLNIVLISDINFMLVSVLGLKSFDIYIYICIYLHTSE